MNGPSKSLSQFLRYTVLIVTGDLPFYLITRNALMTDHEITSPRWTWLPIPPRFENFARSR